MFDLAILVKSFRSK